MPTLSSLPPPVVSAVAGYRLSGENLRTASEAGVFLFTGGGPDLILKRSASRVNPPLHREAAAMRWLSGKLAVPRVLCYHREKRTEYLLVTRLPGISGEKEELTKDPDALVRLFAEGLAGIHALPAGDCPMDRRPDTLLREARSKLREGILTTECIRQGGVEGDPVAVLDRLEETKPPLRCPVFLHGDYSLPNMMVEKGRIAGFVDLGYAGVGDPCYDYVAARYTVNRNLGARWIRPFFEALGVTPDPGRFAWYREIVAFD